MTFCNFSLFCDTAGVSSIIERPLKSERSMLSMNEPVTSASQDYSVSATSSTDHHFRTL